MSIDLHKDITIDEKKLNLIRDILNIVYLVILTFFFLKSIFESSMIPQNLPFDFYTEIKKLLVPVILLKVAFSWESYKKYLLQLMGLGIIAHIMYVVGDFETQLYVWMLAIGAVGIDYNKIIKIFFCVTFFVLFSSSLASFTGAATHLIYQKGDRLRYSFGICYPTDFAAYLLFMTLMGWVAFGRGKEKIMSLIFLLEAIFIYVFCNAWCGYIIATCSAVAALYVQLLDKGYIDGLHIVKNIIWHLEKYAFVIGAVIMIALSAIYRSGNPVLSRINRLLSGRLGLARQAFDRYGIHAFGEYFSMHGNGGNEVFVGSKYNFVDSSYCLILVRYGWVLLAALAVLYIYTINKAKKASNEALVAAMALMALHSMIEHHWPDIAFNPCLIIFFSEFKNAEDKCTAETAVGSREKKGRRAALGLYILIMIICSGYCVSMIRTLNGTKFTTLKYSGLVFMLYAFFVLLGIFLVIKGLCSDKEKSGRIFSTIGLVINAGVLVYSGLILWEGYDVYKSVLDVAYEEKTVISLAEEENCELYVEDVPDFYRWYGYDVKYRLVMENDLCREDNVVLFTTPGKEYHRLLKAGYAYFEINDERALYTDSMEMVYKLQDMGYKVVRMFDYEKKMLLKRKRN